MLPFLKSEKSVIAHTDADCEMLEKYIFYIEAYFLTTNSFVLRGKDNPKIATGVRKFLPEPGESGTEMLRRYDWISSLEKEIFHFLCYNYVCTLDPQDEEPIYFTPGSHLIFTKKIFEQIGGFEHIAGAEDVQM